MRQASVIQIEQVSDVVRRRTADFGVNVRWEPYADTAYTNGRTIVLPSIKQPCTTDQLDTMYGYVIHECGHHSRQEAFKILKAAKPPEHLCALFNITEDDGMEREVAGLMPGDKKALSTTNLILGRQAVKEWNNVLLTAPPTQEQDPAPLAAQTLHQHARSDWDETGEMVLDIVKPCLPDDALNLYNELVNEGWVDRFRSTKTPHDTWDLAVDLAKRLYPDNDQDEYEEIREAGHNMEGQRSDDQSSMEDSQSKGQASQNGGEDQDGEGGTNDEGSVVSWKDVVLSEHNEWEQSDGSHGTVGIDWTGFDDEASRAYMPINEVNVVDYDTRDTTGRVVWNPYMPTEQASRSFANKIRRYIQAQARSRVTREKYHGRLDKGSIVRLALPPIDGGEYNKRIFYDMEKRTMQDTSIMVLVDWSGSMDGRKKHYAADAAQRLVWCFDRVLNVPVALAAFSNGRSLCDVGYIKKFSRRCISPEEIARRFGKFDYYTSANNDSDALNWAHYEILKRKEQRKMIIVLSDGCPTGSYTGGWGSAALKQLAKMIESKGEVDLYGIGICSNAVEDYYSNTRVINNPEEINQALFECIKEGDSR